MRQTLVALVTLTTLCGLGADDKKNSPPPSARVVVSGKSVGQVLVKVTTGGETKKLQVVLVELNDKTKLAVARPDGAADPPAKEDKSGVDPDLKRLLEAAQEKDIAVEGRLSSTENDVVIAAVGGRGAKSVPLLMADRVTDVTAANAKDYPPKGSARVEGVLVRTASKVGRDTADWAIRDGDLKHIPLLLAEGTTVPDVGSKVRVGGAVKVVDGRLVVVATKLDTVK